MSEDNQKPVRPSIRIALDLSEEVVIRIIKEAKGDPEVIKEAIATVYQCFATYLTEEFTDQQIIMLSEATLKLRRETLRKKFIRENSN